MLTQEWWVDFYDGEQSDCALTRNTEEVVEFILSLCAEERPASVLDLCCGKGHLTRQFAHEGVSAIGLDASRYFIDYANQHYLAEDCRFVLADARAYRLPEPVDLIVNWHSSFAGCEADEENSKMLATMSENLRLGGRFILSTFNPDYLLTNFQRFIVRYLDSPDGMVTLVRESFLEDEMLKSHWLFIYPDGSRKSRYGQTKLYTLADCVALMSHQRLMIEQVFGTIDGDPFTPQSPSMILWGRKVTW